MQTTRTTRRTVPGDIRRAFAVLLILAAAVNAACGLRTVAGPKYTIDRNREALETARRNIDRFRKDDAVIVVRGASPDAKVAVRQISHDFKFGVYLKLDDLDPRDREQYESRLGEIFNYAVVGTFWDFIEPVRGESRIDWFDREVATARRLGMRVGAAPVLWGTKEYGTPRWLPGERGELRRVVDEHIRKTVARTDGVEDFEIVNEPLAPERDLFAERLGDGYINDAFRTARQAAPGARLMLNEFGLFGNVARNNRNRDRYFDLAKRLIDSGTPIDVIGIQAHNNGEWFEPADVAETLARYGTLGRPLQISEFSAQTREFDDRSKPLAISGDHRSGLWNDDLQAEFCREFYTVAFGDPNVEAIVAWGLDDKRAWLPGVGLIDAQNRPKPAFEALRRLILEDWRTDLASRPNASGEVWFRGFRGRYEVTVESGGKIVKKTFDLRQNFGNRWLIEL